MSRNRAGAQLADWGGRRGWWSQAWGPWVGSPVERNWEVSGLDSWGAVGSAVAGKTSPRPRDREPVLADNQWDALASWEHAAGGRSFGCSSRAVGAAACLLGSLPAWH